MGSEKLIRIFQKKGKFLNIPPKLILRCTRKYTKYGI